MNTPAPPGATKLFDSGCECLKALIESPRKVTIHPVTDPGKKIKGAAGSDEDTVEKCGGGATVAKDNGGYTTPSGPGKGTDGNVGSDADVYIDMTNRNGKGYDHGMDQWLILAHELTSGHAAQLVAGTCAVAKKDAEAQAIDSENRHRAEHGGADAGYPSRPTGG